MRIRDIAFAIYNLLREAARISGLMGPMRRLAGPVAGRLLYWLSPGGAGPTDIDGHTMYLAPPGSYPPLDMAMARYEPSTTRLFKDTVKPGMVVVDIGAHVGYYTLLAARQVGSTGRVYAFEPEHDNHAILLRNIEENGYNNIVATRMAVSNRQGSSTLYVSGLDSGRHSLYRHGLPERGSAPIETTTLDTFLSLEGWPNIDLIKVDVEGAEVTVLDGMTSLIGRSDGLRLIIEFNPVLLQDGGVPPLEFLDRLLSTGWNVQIIEDDNGLSPLLIGDAPALLSRLLTAESSVNLFCNRQ